MCAKVAYLSFRRTLLLTLVVFTAAGALAGLEFRVIYAVLAWIFVGQVLSLRIKEKKEKWNHLLLSFGGYDWRYPGYLYLFAVLLALPSLMTAISVNWVLGQTAIKFHPAGYSELAVITAAILFCYHCLLLLSEVLGFENLIMVQKVSFLFLVLVLKVLLDWNPGIVERAVGAATALMLFFSLGPVFIVATYLFRRKNHLS
jgi:hypothetical protein